jgi:hypothetical protein
MSWMILIAEELNDRQAELGSGDLDNKDEPHTRGAEQVPSTLFLVCSNAKEEV